MQTDFLQFIFQAINNLLTQNLGFFDSMGQNLFRSFATILVVWYGVKSALSAASGKHPFHFDNFASLLLTISFGFAMVNYYSTPIPGIGRSFHNLITDEAQFLANQINQNELQTVVARVADFETRLSSPGVADFLGTLIYVAVTILLAAAQAIAIVVIAYGFIATAVCVLVGPVFIPFFIVPKLEWLFWGWFRCFIQYAFYQVIAAAVVYVIGNLILGVLRLPPGGTISTVELMGWFPVLFITFLASIYVLLKVPSLTNHIFSGTSGGSSAAILERVFG
ncbi:MAG TPA: type IV secretion system protein [Candidatus Acidoferrales bacterium]|jgi:type IV secretory pathway VirB6-like protein|nr:type IV secretion system protein [Candidatus Acidoferrales bacterium]